MLFWWLMSAWLRSFGKGNGELYASWILRRLMIMSIGTFCYTCLRGWILGPSGGGGYIFIFPLFRCQCCLMGREFFPRLERFKQGDPLFPLLFILVMEALNRLISKAVQGDLLSGFVMGERSASLVVSHLFYADDKLIFCDAEATQIGHLRCILPCFEAVSGLWVNLSKLELILVGQVASLPMLAAVLDCKVARLPVSYLGLPLRVSFKETRVWDGVVDKVQRRLAGWKRQYLSKEGADYFDQDCSFQHSDVLYVCACSPCGGGKEVGEIAMGVFVEWGWEGFSLSFGGLGEGLYFEGGRVWVCENWWCLMGLYEVNGCSVLWGNGTVYGEGWWWPSMERRGGVGVRKEWLNFMVVVCGRRFGWRGRSFGRVRFKVGGW
ncbi:uncharacterized protein LOC114290376 [Camellia sinensis]|uniref:uncharacterized protein LOC114290376 n=1 Tax=Camellia sinensis TaxID=4442 RepID=UPI0010365F8E|nr:uncharacterized protein LOC114290376 [Camellia sinensis]